MYVLQNIQTDCAWPINNAGEIHHFIIPSVQGDSKFVN